MGAIQWTKPSPLERLWCDMRGIGATSATGSWFYLILQESICARYVRAGRSFNTESQSRTFTATGTKKAGASTSDTVAHVECFGLSIRCLCWQKNFLAMRITIPFQASWIHHAASYNTWGGRWAVRTQLFFWEPLTSFSLLSRLISSHTR